MTDIPPNGAVTATVRAFNGGAQKLSEQTVNIKCGKQDPEKVAAALIHWIDRFAARYTGSADEVNALSLALAVLRGEDVGRSEADKQKAIAVLQEMFAAGVAMFSESK